MTNLVRERGFGTDLQHSVHDELPYPKPRKIRENKEKDPTFASSRAWSGWRESNPRLLLGRQGHYHYATPAYFRILLNFKRNFCVSLW